MCNFLGIVTVFAMLWASVGTVLYGCLLDSLGWDKMSFEARLDTVHRRIPVVRPDSRFVSKQQFARTNNGTWAISSKRSRARKDAPEDASPIQHCDP
jgi:hypothetical protein